MPNVGNGLLGGGDWGVFQYLRDRHVEEGLALFCEVPKDTTRINLYHSQKQSLPLQEEVFLSI